MKLTYKDLTELKILGFTEKHITLLGFFEGAINEGMAIDSDECYILKYHKTVLERVYNISRPVISRLQKVLENLCIAQNILLDNKKGFKDIYQITIINKQRWQQLMNKEYSNFREYIDVNYLYNPNDYNKPLYITENKVKMIYEKYYKPFIPLNSIKKDNDIFLCQSETIIELKEKIRQNEEQKADLQGILNSANYHNQNQVGIKNEGEAIIDTKEEQKAYQDGAKIDNKNKQSKGKGNQYEVLTDFGSNILLDKLNILLEEVNILKTKVIAIENTINSNTNYNNTATKDEIYKVIDKNTVSNFTKDEAVEGNFIEAEWEAINKDTIEEYKVDALVERFSGHHPQANYPLAAHISNTNQNNQSNKHTFDKDIEFDNDILSNKNTNINTKKVIGKYSYYYIDNNRNTLGFSKNNLINDRGVNIITPRQNKDTNIVSENIAEKAENNQTSQLNSNEQKYSSLDITSARRNAWKVTIPKNEEQAAKIEAGREHLRNLTRYLYHTIFDRYNGLEFYTTLKRYVSDYIYNHKANPCSIADLDMYSKVDTFWFLAYKLYKSGELDKYLDMMPLKPKSINMTDKGLEIYYNSQRTSKNKTFNKEAYMKGFNLRDFKRQIQLDSRELLMNTNRDFKPTINDYLTDDFCFYRIKYLVLTTLAYLGLKQLQQPLKDMPYITVSRNSFFEYTNEQGEKGYVLDNQVKEILKLKRPGFIKQLLIDFRELNFGYTGKSFIEDVKLGCSWEGFDFEYKDPMAPHITRTERRIATNQQIINRIRVRMFENATLNLTTRGLGRKGTKPIYWTEDFEPQLIYNMIGLVGNTVDGYYTTLNKCVKVVRKGFFVSEMINYQYNLAILTSDELWHHIRLGTNKRKYASKVKKMDTVSNMCYKGSVKAVGTENRVLYKKGTFQSIKSNNRGHLALFLMNDEKIFSNLELFAYLGANENEFDLNTLGKINVKLFDKEVVVKTDQLYKAAAWVNENNNRANLLYDALQKNGWSLKEFRRICKLNVYNNTNEIILNEGVN